MNVYAATVAGVRPVAVSFPVHPERSRPPNRRSKRASIQEASMSEVLAVADIRAEPNRAPEPSASQVHLPLRILLLCAAAFLLAWLPRLLWGFWTDEAGTFWMACKGWREAINRTATFPGQSILYSVLESFLVSQGSWKEPLLRIPSVLAIVTSAWQLKRLAEIGIDRSAGWLTLIPFICAPDIVNFGTSARPYALALAASLASFRYLLEWQKAPDWKTAAKYLIASVLTLYFHYFFGFVFVIQALFLISCRIFGRRIALSLPLAAVILLPVSLLPLVGILRSTARHTDAFAHAVPPTFMQFLQMCFPPALLLTTGLGLLLLWISARNPRWRRTPLRPEFVFLLAIWITLAPVIFFLVSRLTEQSVFTARYLLFTLPAFVLFLVWIISGFERQEWRFLILLAIFAGSALHPETLLRMFRDSPSSWREPIRLIASTSGEEAPPVFMVTGFMDSTWLDWKTQDPRTSALYAPLEAYPLTNRVIGLPFFFGEPVQAFIRQTDFSAYKSGQRLFLVSASDSPLGAWMSNHMEKLGFRAENHLLDDYVVTEFRRN